MYTVLYNCEVHAVHVSSLHCLQSPVAAPQDADNLSGLAYRHVSTKARAFDEPWLFKLHE